jgi:hypothetical protein
MRASACCLAGAGSLDGIVVGIGIRALAHAFRWHAAPMS